MIIASTKRDTHSEIKIGVFAPSGVGKTSLIRTLPCKQEEVLIIDIDKGLEVLRGDNFSQINFSTIESENPIDKMREVVRFLRTPEGLNGFKWLVTDNLSVWAEKVLRYMEKKPTEFGLITKSKQFDGLKMYGELKKVYTAVNEAILDIPELNKLTIFGAVEKENGPDKRMEVLIPGSFGDNVMFSYDDFYGMRVKNTEEGEIRQLVTGHDGYWVAKSRMSGGAGNVLELYEPADLGKIIEKCYNAPKVESDLPE